MNNNKWKGLMALSIFVVLIGAFLLFNSVDLGMAAANRWLSSTNDFVDTPLFHIVLKGNINKYLIAGSLISGFGFIATIISGYKMFTRKE